MHSHREVLEGVERSMRHQTSLPRFPGFSAVGLRGSWGFWVFGVVSLLVSPSCFEVSGVKGLEVELRGYGLLPC